MSRGPWAGWAGFGLRLWGASSLLALRARAALQRLARNASMVPGFLLSRGPGFEAERRSLQTWETFLIAVSALLPMVNPVGSALQLLPLVGDAPLAVYRNLARRIALDNIIFLLIVEAAGSAILRFFGISIPIVEVSGGIVIAGLGWSALNRPDAEPRSDDAAKKAAVSAGDGRFVQKVFYPFTFPITSGPATVVTMLTLSAHASRPKLAENLLAHVGIFAAALVVTACVWGCYAYAPKLARTIAPGTLNGIVRIVSFITMSIGVQIAWNGISALVAQLHISVKH